MFHQNQDFSIQMRNENSLIYIYETNVASKFQPNFSPTHYLIPFQKISHFSHLRGSNYTLDYNKAFVGCIQILHSFILEIFGSNLNIPRIHIHIHIYIIHYTVCIHQLNINWRRAATAGTLSFLSSSRVSFLLATYKPTCPPNLKSINLVFRSSNSPNYQSDPIHAERFLRENMRGNAATRLTPVPIPIQKKTPTLAT